MENCTPEQARIIVEMRNKWGLKHNDHLPFFDDCMRLINSGEEWSDIATMPDNGMFMVSNDLGEVCPMSVQGELRVVQPRKGYVDWTPGHPATHWKRIKRRIITKAPAKELMS
jgi:hypothetical protein